MPKIKFSDWDDLLVKSQQAGLNLASSSLNPTQHGVYDLDEASRRFTEETSAKSANFDEVVRLLGRKNFDVENFRKDIRSVQFVGELNESQKFKFEDVNIDSFLDHHHDTIIFSTINESRSSADREFTYVQGRWAADEWSKSKRQFIESLGHKSSSWNTLAYREISEEVSKTREEELPLTVSRQKVNTLPAFIRGHADIFHKLSLQSNVLISSNKGDNLGIRPCAEVVNVLKSGDMSKFSEYTVSDLKSYMTLFEMLYSVTHEDKAPRPPGYFSPLCFDVESTLSINLSLQVLYDLRRFFENQIFQIWSKRLLEIGGMLDAPRYQGRSGGNNSQFLRSYVRYLDQSMLIPHIKQPSGHGDVYMWVYVYHSLRVGDFLSAINELERLNIGGSNDAAISALNGYLQFQESLSESRLAVNGDLINAIGLCRYLYSQEIISEERDYYKEIVLNILSLSDQDALADNVVISNLEDFMWANIWFEYFRTSLFLSGSSIGSTNNMSLYDRIISFGGSDYYDSDGTSPFIYATVLFACRRFGDAIAYLWKASKHVYAVHLMLVCLHYGLVLPHNQLCCNPRRLGSSWSGSFSSSDESINVDLSLSPTNVIIAYTSMNFNNSHPEISLDYFSFLRTQWKNKCVSIDDELRGAHEFKSEQTIFNGFKELLLSLNPSKLSTVIGNGEKQTGLYKFFTRIVVEKLVFETANELLHITKKPSEAIVLLEYGEMLPEALSEICNQLILSLGSPKIDYWRSIAVQFHDKYILPKPEVNASKGKSKSPDLNKMLKEQGRSYLTDLLSTLLKLSLFFSKANERKWEEAISALVEIELLPSTELEVEITAKKYQENGQSLLRLIDDIFLVAIDCLYMQFNTLRSSRSNRVFVGVITDIDIKITVIQNQAKALAILSEKLRDRFRRKDTEIAVKRFAVDIA